MNRDETGSMEREKLRAVKLCDLASSGRRRGYDIHSVAEVCMHDAMMR